MGIFFQITRGFANWKDAVVSFMRHEKSACHRDAVSVTVTIPSSTKDVSEHLSAQHGAVKVENRNLLLHIISSVRFLCRQGLALRGGGDDVDSNFRQLVRMQASENPQFADWLKRKKDVYTSPEIQNEIIRIMAQKVLREIISDVQQSPFICVMVDETTDNSNKEQMVLVLRRVSDNLDVFEEFVGLYAVPTIEAASLTAAITDIFLRFQLPLSKVRGQCYDGASAMSGIKSGVAKRLRDIEPRAIFTHCYGHSVNLAACDTLKQMRLLSDAVDTAYEITKLIKLSPRRQVIFDTLKSQMYSIDTSPGLRTLCPTRWTVRADCLASILANYELLLDTWNASVEIVRDVEMKSRILGVAAVMEKFHFLLGTMLAELILRHTDNLNKTLQSVSMSAAEGQHVASMTVRTLQNLRNDEMYEAFFNKVCAKAKQCSVGEPTLPRQRKVPKRFNDGLSEGEFPDTPKVHYRQLYFEALDLIISCLQERFRQDGYATYSRIETLLVKACRQEDFESDIAFVCDFYKDDFDRQALHTQLVTLGVHYAISVQRERQPDMIDVLTFFKSLSAAERNHLCQAVRLVQLLLIMPATNSTSERSFSALRRLKTYLRTSMKQERLNNLMVLHVVTIQLRRCK